MRTRAAKLDINESEETLVSCSFLDSKLAKLKITNDMGRPNYKGKRFNEIMQEDEQKKFNDLISRKIHGLALLFCLVTGIFESKKE